MKKWVGLIGFFAILAALALALVLDRALLDTPAERWLVPTPQTTEVNFMRALAAQRYNGAIDLLSDDLRGQVTEDELRIWVDHFSLLYQPIDDVQEQGEQIQGSTATAAVELDTTSNQTVEVVLPLEKDPETHIWQITSLDPLWELIQFNPQEQGQVL